jgi:hypothetical protein
MSVSRCGTRVTSKADAPRRNQAAWRFPLSDAASGTAKLLRKWCVEPGGSEKIPRQQRRQLAIQ